jgi:hypothetical protein
VAAEIAAAEAAAEAAALAARLAAEFIGFKPAGFDLALLPATRDAEETLRSYDAEWQAAQRARAITRAAGTPATGAQRPALPAPAVNLIDQIGVQLDGLGLQLEGVDPAEPAVAEVRKLVGEHLPGMVESYRRIPANLRREQRDGRNADQQLTDGLGKISQEIDAVTRQLAAGDLDALAVRGRFLDYKYGDGLEQVPPQLAAPKAES